MGGLPGDVGEVTEGLENELSHCESLHLFCVTSSQNILSVITCEATRGGFHYCSPTLQLLHLSHLAIRP